MVSGTIKGYYKQKKRGRASKTPSAASKKKSTKNHVDSNLSYVDEYGEEENKLRQFDMDMRYGPCIGLTRLERWERANSMGLNPPRDIQQILLRSPSAPNEKPPKLECLWQGRTNYGGVMVYEKFDSVLRPVIVDPKSTFS